MSSAVEELRLVPLFAGLPDEDLERLCQGVERTSLPAGELLFAEGDDGDRAYVIREGELEVVKITGEREVLLAVRGPGDVIGEMALLDTAPRMASVRARGAVDLLSIPKEQMDELLAGSATAARSLFGVLLARWRETEVRLRQSERMAQLGTLTAGLAHELNNPAAAVRRGADQLSDAVTGYATAIGELTAAGLDPETDDRLRALLDKAVEPGPMLSALERADLEDDLEDALDSIGADKPWKLAAGLAGAGFRPEDVTTIESDFGSDKARVIVGACDAAHGARSLLREVEEGATRLSDIVGALKSYSYLDQAPVQEIDVTKGLEDTLLILRRKLDDIEIVREYADDVPEIQAFGSELNQVWTNLIDNAADAIAEGGGGKITLRVAPGERAVVVEVEDDGPGIPPEAQDRVFDAFFTTKPPGSGTGLGLDISYSIIVHKHRGDISVRSEPGRTVFRVELPTDQDD